MQEVRSVFLVEDDLDDQGFFMKALEDIKNVALFDVAPNGRVAIEKLKSATVLPSVIFVDYNMPIMNGLDFLLEIAKYPLIKGVPVVMLTSALEKREEALKRGAKAFIKKPLDEVSLRKQVEDAVNMSLVKATNSLLACS